MLSEFQKRKFTAFFRQLDDNGSGHVEFSDFSGHTFLIKEKQGWADDNPLFTNLMNAKHRFWQEIQSRVDTDRDDMLSLEEWLDFWEKLVTEISTTGITPDWVSQILISMFQAFEIDGDGAIGLEEYNLYFQSLRVKQDPKQIFDKLDTNGDGKIDIEEFRDIMSQWILTNDPNDPVIDFHFGSFQ